MVLSRDMAADRHIVGHVGEDEPGALAGHQAGEKFRIPSVTAGDPVAAEGEKVAGPGDRLQVGIRLERAGLRRVRLLVEKDLIDLELREAGDLQGRIVEDELA